MDFKPESFEDLDSLLEMRVSLNETLSTLEERVNANTTPELSSVLSKRIKTIKRVLLEIQKQINDNNLLF